MSMTMAERGVYHDISECSILNCSMCASAMWEWSCDQCGEPFDPPMDVDDDDARTCDDCLELKPEGNMANVKLRKWTGDVPGFSLEVDGIDSINGIATFTRSKVDSTWLLGALGELLILPPNTDPDMLRTMAVAFVRERCTEVLEALR